MTTGENAEVWMRDDGRLMVSGPVTIENVVSTMKQGIALFDRQQLTIDLAGVKEVDSSAVSLLLEWQREALRRGHPLLFANIPEKLRTLLGLYGISGLINGNAKASPVPSPVS